MFLKWQEYDKNGGKQRNRFNLFRIYTNAVDQGSASYKSQSRAHLIGKKNKNKSYLQTTYSSNFIGFWSRYKLMCQSLAQGSFLFSQFHIPLGKQISGGVFLYESLNYCKIVTSTVDWNKNTEESHMLGFKLSISQYTIQSFKQQTKEYNRCTAEIIRNSWWWGWYCYVDQHTLEWMVMRCQIRWQRRQRDIRLIWKYP